MTDIEHKARELLAAEYERDGLGATAQAIRCTAVDLANYDDRALRAIATALREPARVTDAMVDRAAKAYDDAAVSEGFVSCCGSDTHTRWMRAALEAALLADGESASA